MYTTTYHGYVQYSAVYILFYTLEHDECQDGVDCKYMIDKSTPTGACAVTILNKAGDVVTMGICLLWARCGPMRPSFGLDMGDSWPIYEHLDPSHELPKREERSLTTNLHAANNYKARAVRIEVACAFSSC